MKSPKISNIILRIPSCIPARTFHTYWCQTCKAYSQSGDCKILNKFLSKDDFPTEVVRWHLNPKVPPQIGCKVYSPKIQGVSNGN